MKWKNKIWKYATAFVVVFLLFNPEMVQLAIFVDAVGLEIFIALLEIQVFAILSVFLNTKIKPIFMYVKHLYLRHFLALSWKQIKKEPECLLLVAPSPSILMCMLVFSDVINIALNAY